MTGSWVESSREEKSVSVMFASTLTLCKECVKSRWMWIWMSDLKSHKKNTHIHMNMINWSVFHWHLNCKRVDFLYSQEGKVMLIGRRWTEWQRRKLLISRRAVGLLGDRWKRKNFEPSLIRTKRHFQLWTCPCASLLVFITSRQKVSISSFRFNCSYWSRTAFIQHIFPPVWSC